MVGNVDICTFYELSKGAEFFLKGSCFCGLCHLFRLHQLLIVNDIRFRAGDSG